MNPTTRFGERAADYSAGRPGYGDDALDFLLENLARPIVVADIGAGTGISSRLLAARGAEVYAIEPNAAMRGRAEPCAGVHVVDATAEATGLPDGVADLVTAFQAFHWFANEAALAEWVRVMRPGGRAALVLNERDESDAFTAAYGEIYRRHALDDTEARRIASIAYFKHLPGRVHQREFPYAQHLDRDRLRQRTASCSYLPHDGAAGGTVRDEVDALFERFVAHGEVRVALRTIVVRIDFDRRA